MPRLPSNPLKKLRRNRPSKEDNCTAEPALESVCGCCHYVPMKPSRRSSQDKITQDDDGSVTTADTTLSGSCTYYRDAERVNACEHLGYIIGDTAVCLLDGFATIMKCCDGTFGKPSDQRDRSCCTTITWGADEVRYIDEVEEPSLQEAEPEPTKTENGTRLVLMKVNNLLDPTNELNDQGSCASIEWEDFNSEQFEVTSDKIVWNYGNDPNSDLPDDEANQKFIEAAFSADFSDFSSFAPSPDVTIEDCSVKSSNTNTTGISSCSSKKKVRSCACCGKANTKEAPVKLKICSRCKTTYYCSAECQKVDWHYGHKNKCKAQILL